MFGRFFRKLLGRGKALAAVWASETGSCRSDNQDGHYLDVEQGVFVVADGMGGAAQGGLASQIVCRCLGAVAWSPLDFEGRVQAAVDALKAANREILDYVHAHGLSRMGSTAAVLLFDLQNVRRASIVYIGDSRVYRIRGSVATALTTDHTIGRELGLYSCAGRNEDTTGRSMRLNHVLTRAVGIDDAMALVTVPVEVSSGDRFLVCSDGVHDVLSAARLAELAATGGLTAARDRIALAIESGGSPDNYTFVLAGRGAHA